MAADSLPAMKRFTARRRRCSEIMVTKRLRTDLMFAHKRPESPTVFMGITGGERDVALAARQCVRKIGAFKLGHHNGLQLLEAFGKLGYFLTADPGNNQMCRMSAGRPTPLRQGIAVAAKKRNRRQGRINTWTDGHQCRSGLTVRRSPERGQQRQTGSLRSQAQCVG